MMHMQSSRKKQDAPKPKAFVRFIEHHETKSGKLTSVVLNLSVQQWKDLLNIVNIEAAGVEDM